MRLVQIVSWLVIAAALAGIAIHFLRPVSATDVPAVAAKDLGSDRSQLVDPFSPPPLTEFGAMVERPLFAASRRFVDKPLEYPAAAPERELPRISLTAVSISSQGKVAIVRELGTGKIRRVPQGGEIDDWTVAEVLPDRIVLELGERRSSLMLFGK